MKTIVCMGSGEFTPAMLEVDRYIVGLIDQPIVCVVPTAAGAESDWWKWVTQAENHFRTLGVESYGLPVRNKADAHTIENISLLDRATIVYLSGGDPGYLLGTLGNSPVWEKMKTKEIVVGSSAGSMFMGSWLLSNIYRVFENNEKNYKWNQGAGVQPYTVWPHFDFILREVNPLWKSVMSQAPQDVKDSWIGIDEDTAIVWQGDQKPKIMGAGSVYYGKNLEWKQF